MYWGHGYGMGWPGMLMGLAMMLLFWGGVIAVTVLIVRALRDRGSTGRHDQHAEPAGADRILAERFARGEIDEQTYRQQREVLRLS